MSKKNKPNFFSKFFKKKSDDEQFDELEAELSSEELMDDDINDYEERYHSDDEVTPEFEPTEGILLDDPEEIFDATEFIANPGDDQQTEINTNFVDQDDEDTSATIVFPTEEDDEIFPISETPPIVVDSEGDVVPSLPSDDDLAEPTMSHIQSSAINNDYDQDEIPSEESDSIENDPTEQDVENQIGQTLHSPEHTEAISQSIDINEIKNYELTNEDQQSDETFADYKLIIKKKDKGIKAFFDKGKNELGKIFKGDYKNLLKNVKRPKNLKSSNFFKELNTEKIMNFLYNPSSRKNIHKAFLATAIVGGTYSTGKMAALIIKGTPNTKSGSISRGQIPIKRSNIAADINSFKNNNVFNALLNASAVAITTTQPEKVVNANILCLKATKASSLPLKLQNTLVLQDSVKSIASVQVRSNKIPKNVREGENLDNIAKVGVIDRQKVILKNLKTGECEYIENTAKKSRINTKSLTILNPNAGKKLMDNMNDKDINNQGNTYKIKKSVRDDLLANISEVLTQARAIQIKNPDGTYSFKMTEIVPGSIYSKLGIQNGDIISEIDGKKIQNLNEIMTKFGTIKDKDHFSLGLKKNGNVETKEYDFE
jgi:type II secretory pathway component PulC